MILRVVPIVWYNLARFFICWYFSSLFLIVIITRNRPFVIPTHFRYFVFFFGSRSMGHQQRKASAKLCNNILAVKMVRDKFNWFSVNTLLHSDSILKTPFWSFKILITTAMKKNHKFYVSCFVSPWSPIRKRRQRWQKRWVDIRTDHTFLSYNNLIHGIYRGVWSRYAVYLSACVCRSWEYQSNSQLFFIWVSEIRVSHRSLGSETKCLPISLSPFTLKHE